MRALYCIVCLDVQEGPATGWTVCDRCDLELKTDNVSSVLNRYGATAAKERRLAHVEILEARERNTTRAANGTASPAPIIPYRRQRI